MRLLAQRAHGKVLVGGLGLGLIVHYLLRNPRVTRIDVVEIHSDVIKLISPKIPEDPRLRIHQGDVFDPEWRAKQYDTVILDLWVGTRDPQIYSQMRGSHILFKSAYPRADVWIWGARDPRINPSVLKSPCDPYFEVVRLLKYF